jgi:hypothetical protein
MATLSQPARRIHSDRIFYSAMGVAIAVVTVWGFAASFYFSRWMTVPSHAPEMTTLLYLHGFAFTGWIVLMVVQPMLIARRDLPLHRKLGYAGAGLAVTMVLLGNLAAIAAMHKGFIGLGDPLVFYAVPFFAINSFAVAVALAVYWRRRADFHKRMILLANVGLLGAAVARIPTWAVQAGTPFTFIFLPNLVTVAGAFYDWRTRGRVHPVWIWGGLAMLASQLVMMAVMGTAPGRAFAGMMAGLWA